MGHTKISLLSILLLGASINSAPQRSLNDNNSESKAVISKFHVDTNIQFRYARTVVTTLVKNPGSEPIKADFNMIIPSSAFISNMSMIIKDKEYVSKVEEKEKAQSQFDEAVNDDIGAVLVRKSSLSRDSNKFTVDSNIEPGDKVVFKLTYEEQLQRKDGQYEYALNIDPGMVVDDFKVEININESLPLDRVFVPNLIESNAIDFTQELEENSAAEVTLNVDDSKNKAKIVFSPDEEYQVSAGEQGVSGKLVVQYDVDRESQDSEVQVIDGYFVHYFVPDNLETLPKHVVFVLDVSGSMFGEKLEQMKDAIFTVLDDMTDADYFNIITFSSGVNVWNQDDEVPVVQATEENKRSAIGKVLELQADGGTNINEALLASLELSKDAIKNEYLPKDVATMIVFLTDGLPSEGETFPTLIRSNIKTANKDIGIPIFTIAFGSDADFALVEKIASENEGAAKKIYEGSDAALQLENFYTQISSPVLSNLKIKYVGGLVDNSSLTEQDSKTLFKGKEFIVAGKLKPGAEATTIIIDAEGKDGVFSKELTICPITRTIISDDFIAQDDIVDDSITVDDIIDDCYKPVEYPKSEAQQFLKNLYAYINIKQIMEQIELEKDETEKSALTKKATDLALENNFVTDLTSLVVVKPENEPVINSLITGLVAEDELQNPEFSARPYPSSAFSAISYSSAPSLVQSYIGGGGGSRTSGSGSRNSIRRKTTISRGSRSTTTTFRSFPIVNDYDNDSYDDVEEEIYTSTASTCSGIITFYTKTYHRGEELELDEDTEELGDFDNKAVSAVIEGSCCWQIFGGKVFGDISKILSPGVEYKGVNSFGSDLFRNVSSVKKIVC